MRTGRLGVAQWLARFVRDPEVYITVSNDVLRRGVAQWLARFVRDEEAGGSSPLTPTRFSGDPFETPFQIRKGVLFSWIGGWGIQGGRMSGAGGRLAQHSIDATG